MIVNLNICFYFCIQIPTQLPYCVKLNQFIFELRLYCKWRDLQESFFLLECHIVMNHITTLFKCNCNERLKFQWCHPFQWSKPRISHLRFNLTVHIANWICMHPPLVTHPKNNVFAWGLLRFGVHVRCIALRTIEYQDKGRESQGASKLLKRAET
jgi:hypothetical protein